jgi:hypothetical protein
MREEKFIWGMLLLGLWIFLLLWIIWGVLLWSNLAHAAPTEAIYRHYTAEQIAEAIYVAEGGAEATGKGRPNRAATATPPCLEYRARCRACT